MAENIDILEENNKREGIYGFFDNFIQTVIIDKKSFIFGNEYEKNEIFTEENIKGIIDNYIFKPIGSNKDKNGKDKYTGKDKDIKNYLTDAEKLHEEIKDDKDYGYYTKINKQFEDDNLNDVKNLFANILFLRYLPIADMTIKSKLDKIKGFYSKNVTSKINIDTKGIATYGMAQQQIDTEMAHLVLMFKFLFDRLYGQKTENKSESIPIRKEGSEENENINKVELKITNEALIKTDDILEIYNKYFIKDLIIDWINNKNNCKADFFNTLDSDNKIWSYRILGIGKNGVNKTENLHKRLPIHNMLLHLCNKHKYEPIASQSNKVSIVKAFTKILDEKQYKIDNKSEKENENIKIDLKIEDIKKTIISKFVPGNDIDFYNQALKVVWSVYQDDKGISPLSALDYKKSIILYGPPGTSKTYSANKYANLLLFDINNKEGLEKYLERQRDNILQNNFKNEKEFIYNMLGDCEKKRITKIQLHPNYTYEDFIWGYQIENSKTVKKKGAFLKLIDKINKCNKEIDDFNKKNLENKIEEKSKGKYVLILDEINRVDVSKLFGELFSAIENRGEEVKLSVKLSDETENVNVKSTNTPKDLVENNDCGCNNNAEELVSTINVPDNLYIIGTMNEIDFSLERLDFALRRRFLWFFHGYSEETLTQMLGDDEQFSSFIKATEELNKAIAEHSDLGKQYEIGHTFFAEINKIAIKNKDGKLTPTEIKKAKEILWNISIKPMLEAYLGNMNQKEKDELLSTEKETNNKSKDKSENKKIKYKGKFADIYFKDDKIVEGVGNDLVTEDDDE